MENTTEEAKIAPGQPGLPGNKEDPVVSSAMEVTQPAAQDPARTGLGLCYFFVPLLQKGKLRLIH